MIAVVGFVGYIEYKAHEDWREFDAWKTKHDEAVKRDAALSDKERMDQMLTPDPAYRFPDGFEDNAYFREFLKKSEYGRDFLKRKGWIKRKNY